MSEKQTKDHVGVNGNEGAGAPRNGNVYVRCFALPVEDFFPVVFRYIFGRSNAGSMEPLPLQAFKNKTL